MDVQDIPLSGIDISEFNTRKDLTDGQHDSSVDDLARSIAQQGLLSPITVVARTDGRYGLIAGQRRFLACRQLGWERIPAIVRNRASDEDAIAISLVENVHRADMNPRDKARAFKALLDRCGDVAGVSRETGVGAPTIRKYLQLLDLAPELQSRLAAGEAKNTDALARLARQVTDAEKQVAVWDQIGGFTQDVQQQIIQRVSSDLSNLRELVDHAAEGAFDYRVVRNCPFDCPTIPNDLKADVAALIAKSGRSERAPHPPGKPN